MTEVTSTGHTGRSDFEQRRAGRILRLRTRAGKVNAEGDARLEGARKLASIIPLGQPILVGHHSEKRHRRDQRRINDGYDKGFTLKNEATALESRARSAERNDAISSDDPNAPERMRQKIAELEQNRAVMKQANALIRRAKGDKAKAIAALVGIGIAAAIAARVVEPDFAGRVGFADYQFTNTGTEIRRLQQRLATLEMNAAAQAAGEERQIGTVTLRESSNRTQLIFPGKPSDETRKRLKSNGFRWAPSEGAWQRHSSPQARDLAERIARELERERELVDGTRGQTEESGPAAGR